MEISVSRPSDGGFTVVVVNGDVDVHSAPHLRDALLELIEDGNGEAVLDLDAVSFIDSTGLGALVSAYGAARDKGGALPLVCTSVRTLRLFAITGLDAVFDVHPSVDDALKQLAAAASDR